MPRISSPPLFNNQRFQNAGCLSQSRCKLQQRMVASEMAIYASPSDQFNSRSNRTMTGKCRSLPRTQQGGNMLILLRTQVDRTDKTPVTARRARVGGLCRFRRPAERVPTRGLKTRRCADVRERCRNGKSRKRMPASGFRQREKPQAAKQDKAAGSCAPRGGHICPRCGQFRGFTRAFQTQRKTAGGRCRMKKARRFKGNRGVPTKNTR